MNSAWPSALLLLTAWTARADDADKLRAIGGGVFTKGGVVAEINLNRSKISDDQLKLVAGFEHLTDLSLEQTKIGDTGLAHLTGLAKLEWLNLYKNTSRRRRHRALGQVAAAAASADRRNGRD